jgi:hypothetical protein
MSSLKAFSNTDLSDLTSQQDQVYFTVTGLGLFHYPFSWVWIIYAVAFAIFIFILIYGLKTKSLTRKEIFLGFVPWLLSLFLSGLLIYFAWPLLLQIYPEYSSILQGFPYNGHDYIVVFVAFSLFLVFSIYQFFDHRLNPKNAMIAPLLTWFIVLFLLNIFLKGAAFFIIPLLFTLFAFFLMVRLQVPSYLFLLILILPSLSIIAPFIQFFPVGLGLKMGVVSAVFTVLLFGNLLPIFGYFSIKKGVATLALLVAIGFFIKAHLGSGFSETQPLPNSLVYALDSSTDTAHWFTYDDELDSWTSPYFKQAKDLTASLDYQSKYNSAYTKSSIADLKAIPSSQIEVDTLEPSSPRFKKFRIQVDFQRNLNRIVVSEATKTNFKSFTVNGVTADFYEANDEESSHVHTNRFQKNIIDYYVVNQVPLSFEFEVDKTKPVEFTFNEISFDLLSHPLFSVKKRPVEMIPKPFIVNDAIITQQKLNL